MKFLLLINSILLFCFSNLPAQNLKKTSDFVEFFNVYPGTQTYSHYTKDTLSIRHGRYLFSSDFLNVIDENHHVGQKLSVSGFFNHDKKHNNWEYRETILDIELTNITGTKDLKLSHKLNGHELITRLSYFNGYAEGRWENKKSNIINNQKQTEKTTTAINFSKGVAHGEIFMKDSIEKSAVAIVGRLNNEGFLDGNLEITYSNDSVSLSEKRLYSNGFLLSLEILNTQTDSCLLLIEYDDVKTKLEELNNLTEISEYKISDKGFGVLFDNGYRDSDPKKYAQLEGNRALNKLINSFSRYRSDTSETITKAQINLTRRFQFIYPDTNDSLISVLNKKTSLLLDGFKVFLDDPTFILNKEKSDSIAYSYAFVQKAKNKALIVSDVLRKIETGYFDFLYRDNYYYNGVKGLNSPDTLQYIFQDKPSQRPFDVNKFVTGPNNLIEQIAEYITALEKETSKKINFVFKQAQYFKEQEKIDALDGKIVHLTAIADSLYYKYEELLTSNSKENMPFSYKVYKSAYNRVIKDLNLDYINETNFDKKIAMGNELTCLLQSLTDNYPIFKEIDMIPASLDSTFTKYTSNPFHPRKAETKILGNIQKAGIRLLHSYVEDIYRLNSCKELNQKIDAIVKLKNRLDELAAINDEEVQKLDRVLRRENVPTRIERILGV